MKRLLFATTAFALVLSSCSNDDEVGTPTGTTGAAMSFRVLTDKTAKATKAAITDDSNMKDFTVSSWWDRSGTPASPDYGGLSNIVNNEETNGNYIFNATGVYRAESAGATWNYGTAHYWPAKDKGTVDFFAYSPASSINVKTGLKDFKKVSGAVNIAYEMPEISDITPQEDFLVARRTQQAEVTNTAGTITGNGGTVTLQFQHALSRITFLAKTTRKDITYVIDEIALVNVNSEGVLDLLATEIEEIGALDYTTNSPLQPWTSTNPKEYVVDMGATPAYLTTDFASVLGKTGAMMVIPQATKLYNSKATSTAPSSDEFAIKVTYRAFVNDINYADDAVYFPLIDPATATDATPKGLVFEMGRQYNLFFTFGNEVGDEITFTVDVSSWDNTVGNINIDMP